LGSVKKQKTLVFGNKNKQGLDIVNAILFGVFFLPARGDLFTDNFMIGGEAGKVKR
jgi:hypothetical protein